MIMVVMRDFDREELQRLRAKPFFDASSEAAGGSGGAISVLTDPRIAGPSHVLKDDWNPENVGESCLRFLCKPCGVAGVPASSCASGSCGTMGAASALMQPSSYPATQPEPGAEPEPADVVTATHQPDADFEDAVENTGVIVTLNACGSSFDDLYKTRAQLGQSVYTGHTFAFVRYLALALRKFFLYSSTRSFPDTAAGLAEAAAVLEAKFQTEGIPPAFQRSSWLGSRPTFRLQDVLQSEESADPHRKIPPPVAQSVAFQRVLKHIVRKIRQAAEKQAATNQEARPQVLLNLECSEAELGRRVFDFDDLGTLLAFGLTVQAADWSLKKLIAVWESAERGEARSGKFLSENSEEVRLGGGA